MSRTAHASVAAVVAELKARLAPLAAVATSVHAAEMDAAGLLVLDGQHATIEEADGPFATLLLPLHALVPVAEAGDAEAARYAALEAAEALFWEAVDAATRRGAAFSTASRRGEVRLRLLRPDRRTLCGAASGLIALRVKHVSI